MRKVVTTVTKITKKCLRESYEKMAERFPDFEIQEIQELKENSENQNSKKITSTWFIFWLMNLWRAMRFSAQQKSRMVCYSIFIE